MAQSKDLLPAQTGWIHELARAEVHPDAERLLQLGKSFDPQQLVEESTIDFLMELREQFNDFAKLFNALSEGGIKYQEIKVYSVAQAAADFMVFRNSIKLVVSNTAHGVIQFSYAQHNRSSVAVMGVPGSQGTMGDSSSSVMNMSGTHDLLAQVGPFRDVFWTYQGEKVSPDQVAKFYFAEFARATRDSKKSKAGNQFLLEQIKALLQEKGLDL